MGGNAAADGAEAARAWIRVEALPGKAWARVVMAREPVNSMSLAFWQRLAEVRKLQRGARLAPRLAC